MAATLVAVSLLSRKLSHSSRCRKEEASLLEDQRAEADPPDAVDVAGQVGFDEQPDLQPRSHLPAVERPAHTQGDETNRGPEVPGVEAAVTQQCMLDSPRKPARYRFRAAEHITLAFAVIAIVTVTVSVVALQMQAQKLAAQVAQSEAAMKGLREQIRTDQRPWIGLTETTVQPLTRTGGGFTIKLQNTGKAPAVDLRISAAVRVEAMRQAADLRAPDFASGDSAGTLMPGAAYATDVWFNTSPDAMSGLARDELRVVNFVRVTYKDVYEGLHTTNICFYWNGSLSRVKLCDGYNDLN